MFSPTLAIPRADPPRRTISTSLARSVFAIVALFIAAAGHDGIAAPVKIMPLGDSITRGSHRAGAVPGGYRKDLANRLGAAGVAFDFVGTRNDNPAPGIDPDHQGIDGIRTDQVLSTMSNWLPRNPDIVLMKLGTNDLIQWKTIDSAVANLNQLITGIVQNAPSRKVFLATILPIVEARDGRSIAEWDVAIRAYNTRVRELVATRAAQGTKVYLVEMHGSVDPAMAFLKTDGTHPGPAGYDRMGEVWFEAIRSHVGAGPPGAPVAVGDSYTGFTGSTLTVAAPGVLANDSSPAGLPLSAAIASPPSSGTLDLAANGGFSYTPPAGFAGNVSFTYTAGDGSGSSAPATVTLQIRQPGSGGIVNGSFENDLAGWTATGSASVKSAAPYAASEGVKLVAFNSGNAATGGTVSQTIPTVAGTAYELAFDYGVLAYNNNPQTIGVEIVGSAPLRSEMFTARRVSTNVLWLGASVPFVADGSATTIVFRDNSATTDGLDLTLDNIRISGATATSPPVITQQPANVVAVEQSTAKFTVAATGAGPLTYQWRRNGSDIDGATAAELLIPGVTTADQGTYDVIVSNAGGSTPSGTATLSVVPPPSGGFANGSFENGLEGWTATGNLSVQSAAPYIATDGTRLVAFNGGNTVPNGVLSRSFPTTPGAMYELEFDYGVLAFNNSTQTLSVSVDGTARLASETVSIQRTTSNLRWLTSTLPFVADSEHATVTFRDVSPATNSLDLLLDNVRIIPQLSRQLTVLSSPADGAIVSVEAAGGENVDEATPFLRAHPDGAAVTLTAPPSLGGLRFQRWTRDGSDAGTNPRIQISLNADTTLTAHYIEGPPVILEDPVDTVAAEGEDVTFTVAAEGTGTLSYQWRRDGGNIPDAVDPSLTLAAVTMDDDASYDVVVSNGIGETTSAPARLTVRTGAEFENGSFEDGFAGWTVAGNVTIQQGGLYTSVDGNRLVAFNNGNTVPNGTLSRAFATVPGRMYDVAFHFGVLAYNNNSQTLEVSVTGTAPLALSTYTIQRRAGSNIHWESRTLRFTADSPLSTLLFRDRSTVTNSLDLTLDHVRVTAVSTAAAMEPPMLSASPIVPDAAALPPSVLAGVPRLDLGNNTVDIEWDADFPAPYEIQRSENLRDWETIHTFDPGDPIRFTDESPPPNGAFYRVARPK